MSLENELNEILENTDKVYVAGQTSIAETKMDKFGTYTPGVSIEDKPGVIEIDGTGLYFNQKTSFTDCSMGLDYFFGPRITAANQDEETQLMIQPEGLVLNTATTNNQDVETLMIGCASENGDELESGVQGLWIKSKNNPLHLASNKGIVCKVGNNFFVIDKSGAGMASVDTENWIEQLLPMVGKTDAKIPDSFVTVSYLEEYIKTLEDRIKALEGGTE